jgi:hypothetical protein
VKICVTVYVDQNRRTPWYLVYYSISRPMDITSHINRYPVRTHQRASLEFGPPGLFCLDRKCQPNFPQSVRIQLANHIFRGPDLDELLMKWEQLVLVLLGRLWRVTITGWVPTAIVSRTRLLTIVQRRAQNHTSTLR